MKIEGKVVCPRCMESAEEMTGAHCAECAEEIEAQAAIDDHTPGPWTVHTYSDDYPEVVAPSGTITPSVSTNANAYLIAAAPDLLAALEEVVGIMRCYHKGEVPGDLDACEIPDNCGHCLAMRKAKAAIAKVREPA